MHTQTRREQWLRAVRFERPDHVPIQCGINNACWHHYPQDELQASMADHPLLFPDYQPWEGEYLPDYAPWRRADAPFTDSWGCVWVTAEDGLTGAVVERALASWDAWDGFVPPDAGKEMGWAPIDWLRVAQGFQQAEAQGRLKRGSLRHGHTFLTLSYLRGYENLIYDMMDGEPRLLELIAMVEQFNLELVRRYVALGTEWMGYPEDLGMQIGPMLSPRQFRRYIMPSYRRLVAPALDAGCVIHMHSDGDVRELAEDLIAGGVQVLNLQDLVNGIDWMAAHLKGRICIDLDIDRQNITRAGTPQEIDALIRREVQALGGREGGLILRYDFTPGTPLPNARAVMDAMERYAGYWS